MQKRLTLLFTILCGSILTGTIALAADKNLEILYPVVNGIQPKVIQTELPEYFNYVFIFAISVIGLIIFGVFVYYGTRYLASAGNVAMLQDAKEGIGAALLGLVILLCAFIIFNTVNPQLTVFEISKLPYSRGGLASGVFICNYVPGSETFDIDGTNVSISNVDQMINFYINGNEQQIKAAEQYSIKIQSQGTRYCDRIEKTNNLREVIRSGNNYIFFIPTISSTGTEVIARYNWGIILHEKDNEKGRCRLGVREGLTIFTPDGGNDKDKTSYSNLFGTFDEFDIKSVSLFMRRQEVTSAVGTTFFQCMNYNENLGLCPGDPDLVGPPPPPEKLTLKPNSGDDFVSDVLGDLSGPNLGTRSINNDPPNGFFTIVQDGDQNCEVVSGAPPSIMLLNLNTCKQGGGTCSTHPEWYKNDPDYINNRDMQECVPCILNATVIKGSVI